MYFLYLGLSGVIWGVLSMGRSKRVFSSLLCTEYLEACSLNGGFSVDMGALNSGVPLVPLSCKCGSAFSLPREQVVASVRYFIRSGTPLRLFCSPQCRALFYENR